MLAAPYLTDYSDGEMRKATQKNRGDNKKIAYLKEPYRHKVGDTLIG